MKVVKIDKFEDGSCWAAVVKFGNNGVVSASYVSGKLSVTSPSLRRTGIPSCNPKLVSKVAEWAKLEIANLEPSWHAKHSALYGI